ncbi:MAG: hypothetical protein GX218_05795 [Clostridiaceae bacterium]|nr:hypothetical protein [Clostridiaceae bacterium]
MKIFWVVSFYFKNIYAHKPPSETILIAFIYWATIYISLAFIIGQPLNQNKIRMKEV